MADLREKEIERLERQVLNQSSKIKSMDDFSSPEYLYQELINSINKYHPSADTTMVEKAYNLDYMFYIDNHILSIHNLYYNKNLEYTQIKNIQ